MNEQSEKTKLFIEKARKIHGDKYDYSKVEYKNCDTKVIIICKEHGEFSQIPYSHLSGRGCKKCANTNHSNNSRSNTKEFIEKSIIIHDDKYDYSKVEYIDNSTKIIIICKEHREFLQRPNNHLNGQGCINCGIENTKLKLCGNTEEFIQTAKEIHGDKYDYSKVIYKNSKLKIILICKEHEEFEQTPSQHLSGQGCKKCGIENVTINQTSNTHEFIEKARKIHGDKYDYSKVEYISAIDKVIIICKTHGEFLQQSSNHLSNKAGCNNCAIENRAENHKSNNDEFIEKARKIHGDKYDYSKVEYISAIDKVIIICKTHGEFLQQPSSHLSNRGCKKCYHTGYSKIAIQYLDFISKYNNIQIQHWNKINKSIRTLQRKFKSLH